MPIVKGPRAKSRKGFSESVKKEIQSGKPKNQALAIAYSEAKKAGMKDKKHDKMKDMMQDKAMIKKMVKPRALKK